jgi:endonuclease-3
MITPRKIAKIQAILTHLYPTPLAPLDYTCAFTFLCAVVLSAQTTDGKVNEVTKKLFKLASTPEQMAALSVSQVQEIIQPVGLAPKKAQYLVGLSQKLVTDFDSLVPDTYEELESLPGVGHKTASVIMSHVYEVPAFAVDTHVHRLSQRWGLCRKEEQNVNNVQKELMKHFPQSSWGLVHLQMIYFGREYCVAKGHDNSTCPMCSWIHRKDDKNENDDIVKPIAPSTFTKAKGIVYYADRLAELRDNPLPSFGLHKRGRVT